MLAMQIELYSTLQRDLSTNQTLQEALRDISIAAFYFIYFLSSTTTELASSFLIFSTACEMPSSHTA